MFFCAFLLWYDLCFFCAFFCGMICVFFCAFFCGMICMFFCGRNNSTKMIVVFGYMGEKAGTFYDCYRAGGKTQMVRERINIRFWSTARVYA